MSNWSKWSMPDLQCQIEQNDQCLISNDKLIKIINVWSPMSNWLINRISVINLFSAWKWVSALLSCRPFTDHLTFTKASSLHNHQIRLSCYIFNDMIYMLLFFYFNKDYAYKLLSWIMVVGSFFMKNAMTLDTCFSINQPSLRTKGIKSAAWASHIVLQG